MINSRRKFIQQATTSGCYMLAACAGIFKHNDVFAEWAKTSFSSDNLDQTLERLYSGASIIDSNSISLNAPLIAEDGAVVPIKIFCTLENVESIALLVEKNPVPLAAVFNLSKNVEPFVSAQIKMAETSDVIAVIKTDKTLYSAKQTVKVTIGGCGG